MRKLYFSNNSNKKITLSQIHAPIILVKIDLKQQAHVKNDPNVLTEKEKAFEITKKDKPKNKFREQKCRT